MLLCAEDVWSRGPPMQEVQHDKRSMASEEVQEVIRFK